MRLLSVAVITCRFCGQTRFPTLSYSKDGPMNEWTFNVGYIDQLLGAGT